MNILFAFQLPIRYLTCYESEYFFIFFYSRCLETLCKWQRGDELKTLIHLPENKYGGSPLHWAKNKKVNELKNIINKWYT